VVPVRKLLHIALAIREHALARIDVLVAQRRRMRREVELYVDTPRAVRDLGVVFVVEDLKRAVRQHDRVVLPCEAHSRPQLERTAASAEAPEDLAQAVADLVGGPRVAGVDQHVLIRLDVDRVDVEPVPDRSSGVRHGPVGVSQRDVAQRVPFEHHQARSHVDLLDRAVLDDPVRRTADRAEVRVDRLIDRDPGHTVRLELEIMQIHRETVTGLDARDRLVARVVDQSLADAVVEVDRALPVGKRLLAEVALDAQVRRLQSRR